MGHTAVYGMTESGKSSIVRDKLIPAHRSRGINCIILDPLMTQWGDPDDEGLYVTDDVNEFLRVVWRSRNCLVIVDEAGESAGHYDKAMVKVATRGRHLGHNAVFIVQRANLISNTIRDQCSFMFLFASSSKDAKQHAEEWNDPELLNATTLQQGEYYAIRRMGKAERRKLF